MLFLSRIGRSMGTTYQLSYAWRGNASNRLIIDKLYDTKLIEQNQFECFKLLI